MIEAVNSVLANASLLRNSADQNESRGASSAAAVSAESAVVAGGPRAPFISPFIHVDVNFDTAVLQIRDSDTGDVVRQFPSESTLEARRRADATRARLSQSQESQFADVADVQSTDGAGSSDSTSFNLSNISNVSDVSSAASSSGGGVADAQVAAAAFASTAQASQAVSSGFSTTV